jgi:cytochrome c oxidase assembly factor CtaG
VHALQHLLFLTCGVAMWMALLGPLPKPAWFGNLARLGYIVLVRLIESVLANLLLWSGAVLYPRYAAGERKWHVTPINDQVAAGAIMMIEGSVLTIALFGWLFLRAARESEERDALRELAASRGVELDEGRAARAVAAGRGDALRERILAQAPAAPDD